MKRLIVLLALVVLSPRAGAQTVSLVPRKHIPEPVMNELRALEQQFEAALVRDCAPERCVPKGCIYRDHVVVDLPRSTSLPGLNTDDEGLGSVPPQEYLTQAQCEFAHEKSVAARDLQALSRRLEQRLSKGWLKVTVARQALDPISPALGQSPGPTETPPAAEPTTAEPPATPPAPPSALRELWTSLLPHFAWMIAVVLATLATLAIIWALRRLGRESLEEKALLAQLTTGAKDDKESPAVAPAPSSGAEASFVAEQQRLWTDRIAQAELAKDESVLVELLRGWLRNGEFALLAKAIFLFGDRLSLAFPADGDLAVRKVEFADYLRNLDEGSLPSDAEFFRKLNHHAVSSSLLSQADAAVYHSLRDEFGSTGLAALIGNLPPRPGAILFALVSSDFQPEVVRAMPPALRTKVAAQLLVSNRMSKEEQGYVFAALEAARMGQPLPPAPPSGEGLADRGREFDGAGALSVLLTEIPPEDRAKLMAGALARTQGIPPAWYQDILFPGMLLRLPEEVQAEVLLDVDVKALAGWLAGQNTTARDGLLAGLTPSVRNAVLANMAFDSRVEQLRLARRGRDELAHAVKKQVAGGKVSFTELVA